MHRKIITWILLLIIILTSNINNSFATKKNTFFRITAYYSPLPNQTHYIKWNYIKEIRMNWHWIKWASGKKVFSWMLAAPSNYKFWTKIKLKWLWIWEVSDRWWAIVKAGKRNFKYDRIDIWCGYWEEGLQRAMFWGNRIIEWEIVPTTSKTTLNINKIPSPKWTIYHAIKNPDFVRKWIIKNQIYLSWKKKTKINSTIIPFHKEDENNIFNWPIKNSNQVKILQEKLTEMNLYSKKINWEYSSIKEIILKFQLDNNVINKKTNIWAGNFWPKTRKEFRKKYNLFLKNKKIKKQLKIKVEKRIKNIWKIKVWDISHQVRDFQKVLKEVWYFNYKDTAIFWTKTKESLIKYQLDKKLIQNRNIYWAGIFWPKTKKALIQDLVEKEIK